MAKTFNNLIHEARELLQDTDSAGYRYPTETLRNKLNRGLQELARIRPDAFWAYFLRDDLIVIEVVATDPDPDSDEDVLDAIEDQHVLGTAEFNLPMQFYGPLVFWVTGSAELIDDEFVSDGRAITLLQQFKAMCTSV